MADYTKGQKMGAWRKQAACRLNGLCVIDFDHIEGDPREVWAEAYAKLSEEDQKRILFVFVTPSGHGLKVVFIADINVGNLIDNQKAFSLKLGLNPDESCKDASRGAFLTTSEDIIFIDEERLINYESEDFGKKYDAEYHAGHSQPTLDFAEDSADSHHLASVQGAGENQRSLSGCDGVMGWRYRQKKPDEVMEALRKSGAVTKGSGTSVTSGISSPLQQEGDIYGMLPLDKWAEELQKMAGYYPCMKELFINVHPHKLPAVWFSSAALFGTLMTRAFYHFWYEPEIVRRLNYCIFIIGDPGAGKNIVEKFYKKIADPMIQADQCLIDAVNRYKEGRTERTTSTKAQKGEALKRPVVGIRVHPARTATGEFIRKLPDEFRTQQFMEVFGCSQQTASRAIIRFQEDGMVEKVKYGLYKKVVSELP